MLFGKIRYNTAKQCSEGCLRCRSIRRGVLITLLGCVEPLTATLTTALFMHTAFAGMDLIGFAFILAKKA